MKVQLENKGDLAEVTVRIATKIVATGDVGDGSMIIAFGVQLEGGARELAYLKKQFDGSSGLLVMQREDNGCWMAYTTMFNGRTDWPKIHAEFEELVAVLSALLSLLRYSGKRITCKNMNWYGPNQTCGFIGTVPASICLTASTDNYITLPDPTA